MGTTTQNWSGWMEILLPKCSKQKGLSYVDFFIGYTPKVDV